MLLQHQKQNFCNISDLKFILESLVAQVFNIRRPRMFQEGHNSIKLGIL